MKRSDSAATATQNDRVTRLLHRLLLLAVRSSRRMVTTGPMERIDGRGLSEVIEVTGSRLRMLEMAATKAGTETDDLPQIGRASCRERV